MRSAAGLLWPTQVARLWPGRPAPVLGTIVWWAIVLWTMGPAGLLRAECLPVEEERIRAGQLAVVNPVFAALPPAMPVGFAPAPGLQRVFGIGELGRLAAAHHLPAAPLRGVCFSWPMRPIAADEMEAAMRRSLDLAAARIVIVEQSRLPAPPGELVFPRQTLPEEIHGSGPGPKTAPSGGMAGSRGVVWKGYVRYGEDRKFLVWARVRITAPAASLVARHGLRAGAPIEADQVEIRTLDRAPGRGDWLASVGEAMGRAPRMNIPAGTPLRESFLSPARDIGLGDLVAVDVAGSAIRVVGVFRAEAAGRRGDIIPVRNLSSGRRFSGRVESPGKVVVQAGGPRPPGRTSPPADSPCQTAAAPLAWADPCHSQEKNGNGLEQN